MNKLKYGLVTLLLFLTFSLTTQAQRVTQTPNPVLQACEEAADKAKRLEIENASLKEQLRLKDEFVVLEKERTANKEEQVQFYKKLYENSTKIDTNSSLIILNLRNEIADYKLELAGLRNENESLRRSRTTRMLISAGLGAGIGFALGR